MSKSQADQQVITRDGVSHTAGVVSLGFDWGEIWGVTSGIVGIGVLRCVCHRCTRGCARKKVGDVVLLEVDGVSTLGSPVLSTLRAGIFLMIFVRRSIASQYLSFSSAVGGGASRRVLSRSCAVRSVRSSSDKVGTLQCVGYNFIDPEVRNPRVSGSKNLILR